MYSGYETNEQLPNWIRDQLPSQAQDVYRLAYNADIARGHHPGPAHEHALKLSALTDITALDDDDLASIMKYDPSQPRAPAGTSHGGRWIKDKFTGDMVREDPEIFNQYTAAYWHGTSDEVLDAILKEGLIPGEGRGADEFMRQAAPEIYENMMAHTASSPALKDSREQSVYLANDRRTAEKFANYAKQANPGTGAVVFEVHVPSDVRLKVDEYAWDAYRHVGRIPPEWITSYRMMKAGRVFYIVILTDEGLAKYSPTQPREPAGTPIGGRFRSDNPDFDRLISQLEDAGEREKRTKLAWDIPEEGNILSGRMEDVLKAFSAFDGMGGRLKVYPNAETLGARSTWARAMFTQYDKQSGELTEIIRDFKQDASGEWIVDHDTFVLGERFQGQGYAKKFMRDSMDLYEKLGVKRVTTFANLDVGGYAWAKYGFKSRVSDGGGQKGWMTEAEQRLDYLENPPDSLRRAVRMAGANTDGTGVWSIADMTLPVRMKAPNGQTYEDTAGRMLLRRSGWKGYLNLDDKQSMDRFNRYTGRTPN